MSENEYLPCIVAMVLIRESLDKPEREALGAAAEKYVELRVHHAEVMKEIERMQDKPDHGLRMAGVQADFAAALLMEIFVNRALPTVHDTYVLGNKRPDYLIATAMQHCYDLLGWQARLNVKAKLRELVEVAAEPLDDEVRYVLALVDSWEAWELEQQLM